MNLEAVGASWQEIGIYVVVSQCQYPLHGMHALGQIFVDFWLVLLIGFYDSACLMKQKGDVKIDTGYIATDNGTRFGSVDMTVGHMCCLASLTVWISDQCSGQQLAIKPGCNQVMNQKKS